MFQKEKKLKTGLKRSKEKFNPKGSRFGKFQWNETWSYNRNVLTTTASIGVKSIMHIVVANLIYSVIVPDSKQDTNEENRDAFSNE